MAVNYHGILHPIYSILHPIFFGGRAGGRAGMMLKKKKKVKLKDSYSVKLQAF